MTRYALAVPLQRKVTSESQRRSGLHKVSIAIIAFGALLVTLPCAAQEAELQEKRFRAHRVETPPVIDGLIRPGEWAGAAEISDLHEVEPLEYAYPSERTVWYFAFDEKALYVAAHAYDTNPAGIVAKVLRQGASLDTDDSLTLIIDPFNNKRSGYSFALNPNGVRAEAIYASATRPSDDWDGIWRGASAIVEDGWTVEMAIPFNTITFDPANDTWGINVWRRVARKAQRIAWQSRSGEVNPTVAGEASGFEKLSQGVGLDLVPSASAGHREERSQTSADHSDADLNPSLDVSYKLTPSINGLVTINTDFAATEVDSRQLGLERFSLFFPEKRSFFLTDFDIFQFGGVPSSTGFQSRTTGQRSGNNGLAFFSRRIGLTSDREPVDIIAGAKVSGRAAGYDFGTLYIRQDEYVTTDGQRVDASDLLVGRVSTGVLAESAVGGIVTYGNPGTNLDSSLIGADFLYRNTRLAYKRSMQGDFWIQKSDNEGVEGDDIAWSATLGFPARIGFEAGVQVQELGENYEPALGFANRTGVRLYGGEAKYTRILSGTEFLREMQHSVELANWRYLDTGLVQTENIQIVPIGLRSIYDDFVRIDVNLQKEGLLPGEQPLEDIGIFIAPGEYSFERYGTFMRSARYRRLAVELRIDDGGWYNGERFHVRPKIAWIPSEHLAFALEYDFNRYDFPGQSAITRQLTLENEIAFDARWSLVTLAQYDNLSETIGINSRLRFNMSAGRDIWFVIDHNMFRPDDEERFHSTTTDAVAKIRYTFRF